MAHGFGNWFDNDSFSVFRAVLLLLFIYGPGKSKAFPNRPLVIHPLAFICILGLLMTQLTY